MDRASWNAGGAFPVTGGTVGADILFDDNDSLLLLKNNLIFMYMREAHAFCLSTRLQHLMIKAQEKN